MWLRFTPYVCYVHNYYFLAIYPMIYRQMKSENFKMNIVALPSLFSRCRRSLSQTGREKSNKNRKRIGNGKLPAFVATVYFFVSYEVHTNPV